MTLITVGVCLVALSVVVLAIGVMRITTDLRHRIVKLEARRPVEVEYVGQAAFGTIEASRVSGGGSVWPGFIALLGDDEDEQPSGTSQPPTL